MTGARYRCTTYGCSAVATHEVRGTNGYPWRGFYCDEHTAGHSGLYDHQGGFMVRRIDQTRWSHVH